MTPTKLTLKDGKNSTRIPTDAIVQVAGWGNYSLLWLRDGRQIVSAYTLKVYQNLLPPYFLRVHRGSLVNGHCIVGEVGQRELLLSDGNRVEISRRKIGDFRTRFADFMANQLPI